MSDSEFHILNNWRQEDQSIHEVIHCPQNLSHIVTSILYCHYDCWCTGGPYSDYQCILKLCNISNKHQQPHFGRSRLQNWTYAVSPSVWQLMSALAAVGPPNPREDPECCSILHGLVAAVEALCKITELQHERRTALMDTADRVANRGRIICLTNAKR